VLEERSMMLKVLRLVTVLLVITITIFGVIPVMGNEGSGGEDSLVSQYSDKEFDRYQHGNTTIFFHQRMIGEAAVEGDFLNYRFDTESGELVGNSSNWRENMPSSLPTVISESEALKKAGGEGDAQLYYLSSNSTIYRPAPETPVWVVWHSHEPDRWGNVTVIDAITGEFIASGIPPIVPPRTSPGKVVLDNGVEATFLGRTPEMKNEWQVSIGAPKYLDDLQTLIDPSWSYDNDTGVWNANANLFSASARGPEVILEYEGLKLSWEPDVFVGTEKQNVSVGQLLGIDPVNENYCNNTIRWSYGNITRSVRIIEGMLLEYYTIDSLPADNITIVSNIVAEEGFDWARHNAAWDSNSTRLDLAVEGDNLTLGLEAMKNASFPIIIDPSSSFTTSSSDGCLEVYPANFYDVARDLDEATKICDWQEYFVVGQYRDDRGKFYISRSFVYFDTLSLPENAEITSAVLRLRTYFDHSDEDFYVQIQDGMPDHPEEPNLTKADYNRSYYSGDGGKIATTNFEVNGWNEIYLTSYGQSWINTDDTTKFALRSSNDINILGEPDGREAVAFWAYEKGRKYWPELEITYETSCTEEALIFTGPIYDDPCFDGWYIFVDNVEHWLGQMGYSVFRPADYPNESVIEPYIGNNVTAILYEHCHGDSDYFWNSCDDMTYDEEIVTWLKGYSKMPFMFLANCGGLCETGPGTIVHAFTKGSLSDTVVVGYCGMSESRCSECATYRCLWENQFFQRLSEGYTVEEAYNNCNDTYPFCEDCILYYGDGDTRLVPKVVRPEPPVVGYVTGEVRDVNANLLSNVVVSLSEHGGGFYGSDVASPEYSIEVDQTGDYWLRASRYAYFTLDTNAMPGTRNPWHEDYIDLSTPELLEAGYVLDFEGDYGLAPTACDMSYAMTSVNHWLYAPIDGEDNPHPEWQLSGWKAMESVHSWQFPSKALEGAKTRGITRAAIESASTVVRYLPSCLNRGETFNVTVTFTATEDDFNAIGVTDFGPEGWNTTINISHSIPEADNAKCRNNTVEIAWNGPYVQNTTFTAVYQVTVPEDAQPGNYTFGSGFLEHYIAATGPYIASIGGECKTAVIGVENATLEGLVSFQGRGTPPSDRWIEPFEVRFFQDGNEMAWSPMNGTTNTSGYFNITGIPAGTYNISIKNWTCLSELETGVDLIDNEVTWFPCVRVDPILQS